MGKIFSSIIGTCNIRNNEPSEEMVLVLETLKNLNNYITTKIDNNERRISRLEDLYRNEIRRIEDKIELKCDLIYQKIDFYQK